MKLTGEIVCESPLVTDGPDIWRIVAEAGLDLNSRYAYLLWCRDFSSTSVVARTSGQIVGVGVGYVRPDAPETVFVWQIAVVAAHRSKGVAAMMLDFLIRCTGAEYLEATVTPSNLASNAMFASLAKRWRSNLDSSKLFTSEVFPDSHEDEYLYRIGPLTSGRGE